MIQSCGPLGSVPDDEHLREAFVLCGRILCGLCVFMSFAVSACLQDTIYINNKAKVLSSDIISTNGVIHIIDKLLSPQHLLVTPKDASGRVLVCTPLSPPSTPCLCHQLSSGWRHHLRPLSSCCFKQRLFNKSVCGC